MEGKGTREPHLTKMIVTKMLEDIKNVAGIVKANEKEGSKENADLFTNDNIAVSIIS